MESLGLTFRAMTHKRASHGLAPGDLRYLSEMIASGGSECVQALSTSATAWLALSLAESADRPIIIVTDGPLTQDAISQDLRTLDAEDGSRHGVYPGWENVPTGGALPQPDLTGDRLRFLNQCMAGPMPPITVSTLQALMQRTISAPALATSVFAMRLEDALDLDEVLVRLQSAGYAFGLEVSAKGEAARRGGILDVWPPTEPWPIRIEWYGPTVDSMRTFDPHAQRSLDRRQQVVITPASEWVHDAAIPPQGTLFDYLPQGVVWIDYEPASLRHHAQVYQETIEEAGAHEAAQSWLEVDRLRRQHASGGVLAIGLDDEHLGVSRRLDIEPLDGAAGWIAPESTDRERRRFLDDLSNACDRGEDVRLFFATDGGRDRFLHQMEDGRHRLSAEAVAVGRLSEGFRIPALGLTRASEHDLYGRRKALRGRYDLHAPRPGPSRLPGQRVTEWTDLQPGDHVVHVEHGIGRYLGLFEVRVSGELQEVLTIAYDADARLHVPVSHAHLLSRYVGAGVRPPTLHKLGGRRWAGEKRAMEAAVRDLAASMLETQAARECRPGLSFPPDTDWQHEFEMSFPFEETIDQRRAIEEVKADMERSRPMDRLVCGDVGYGKTEVAMRAAFKAVISGKQVAVLVPTTVLAQQHFDSFAARMAAFPVAIDMLSRFQSRGEQRAVIQGLTQGTVDIVIGTHRLLQKDIAFHDLGLLIIDEEQRFGVEQKEFLKQMRQLVDVLTLTATPIPRTLYMGLVGTRDMSTIQSPPQERLPIETHFIADDEPIIRKAILRELNREGQVYFLHNRVKTINRTAERLARLVPEARIAVAHGQMAEHGLSEVMHDFVRGDYDVLLCTTIIESGVDIPNVNTIIIDRADRFGLAELYQLRGRVGRYKHQAYAYLVLPSGGSLLAAARKRIQALQQHRSLGSGFKLALKDLEIRGAGNLLGAEQSGHISAVGFELYCQFLRRTVARLKGEPVPALIDADLRIDFVDQAPRAAEQEDSAVVPADYIEDEDLRVLAYRKIATCSSESEIDDLRDELRDRFGPPPPALDRLLKVRRVRVLAAWAGIAQLETRDGRIVMTRGSAYVKDGALFPRLHGTSADARLDSLIEVVRRQGVPSAARVQEIAG
jgi:transcription-repair coupling factor (superfamily II helicase)